MGKRRTIRVGNKGPDTRGAQHTSGHPGLRRLNRIVTLTQATLRSANLLFSSALLLTSSRCDLEFPLATLTSAVLDDRVS